MKLLNKPQIGRYLLAKSFLRRMVQKDKNIKQMSHYAQETGRSMVEMLGVLAIIGVLSVGGITGYSKAMQKHKLNKHLLTMNELINNVSLYIGKISGNSTDEDGTTYYTETFYKAGFTPDGMKLREYNSRYLYDIFDNGIWLYYNTSLKISGMGYSFSSDSLDRRICINLVNIAKEHSSDLNYFLSDQQDAENGSFNTNDRDIYYGDKYCSDTKRCIKN
ncbi:MAG: hypothetical protein IJ019_01245, partial [Alphaproteobacteria bacterium]|nr:hypothetical protein [Alphaproteobacteria bacterium]